MKALSVWTRLPKPPTRPNSFDGAMALPWIQERSLLSHRSRPTKVRPMGIVIVAGRLRKNSRAGLVFLTGKPTMKP